MIKGVFFDMGGTLLSYRNLPQTSAVLMERLAAELALEATQVTHHYRLANQEVDKQFIDKPYYLIRDYFDSVFVNFLDRIDKLHLRDHFAWYADFERGMLVDCMVAMPDCHDTLDRLKDMGLYLSAVSNNDEDMLVPMIEREQLHRWLSHWTSSEAARSCKPDARIFELALEKSGLSAEEVMFVGDSREQDIRGAHALGMTTVLLAENAQQPPLHVDRAAPEPHFRISRLGELPAIIDRLGG